MGMSQPFRTTASWDDATQMLDTTFPLMEGSHGTVSAYLMHFDHLVAIQADGSVTSLRQPSQFIEAGGNPECPQSIILKHQGILVDIEPATRTASTSGKGPRHRLQLLTTLD